MTIFHFVKSNNFAETRTIVEKATQTNNFTPLNEHDEFGWTPMHYAAAFGYSAILRLFLAAKLPLQKSISSGLKQEEQDTPLDLALLFKQKESLDVFMEFESTKSALLQNPKYQTLNKVYRAFKKLEIELPEGFHRNLELAKLVDSYIKQCNLSVSNIPGNDNPNLHLFNQLEYQRLGTMRQLLSSAYPPFGMHPNAFILFCNYYGEKTRLGNCDVQAAMGYCLARYFLNQKAEVFLQPDMPHYVVVYGRDDNASYDNTTWGTKCCIGDSWLNKFYSALEMDKQLIVTRANSVDETYAPNRSAPPLPLKLMSKEQFHYHLPIKQEEELLEEIGPVAKYYTLRFRLTREQKLEYLTKLTAHYKKALNLATPGNLIPLVDIINGLEKAVEEKKNKWKL